MEWGWFVLGLAAGMRTLTPIAVLCITAATLGYFPGLHHTWGAWAGSWISAIVFGLMALGEYVGDLLPRTPSRREWFPATSRLVFGALVGGLAATAMTLPATGGFLLGAIGAAAGTTGGWWVRTKLATRIGRDWPIGIAESLLALSLSLYMCWRIQIDATFWDGVAKDMSMVEEAPLRPSLPTPRAEFPRSR